MARVEEKNRAGESNLRAGWLKSKRGVKICQAGYKVENVNDRCNRKSVASSVAENWL